MSKQLQSNDIDTSRGLNIDPNNKIFVSVDGSSVTINGSGQLVAATGPGTIDWGSIVGKPSEFPPPVGTLINVTGDTNGLTFHRYGMDAISIDMRAVWN